MYLINSKLKKPAVAWSRLDYSDALVAFSSSGSTSAMNTTGAGLLVAVLATPFGGYAQPNSFTDSAGNSWTMNNASESALSGNWRFRVYYCMSPITSSSHTVTISAPGTTFTGVSFHAFAGSPVSGKFEVQYNEDTSGTATSLFVGTKSGYYSPGQTASNMLVIQMSVFDLYDATSVASDSDGTPYYDYHGDMGAGLGYTMGTAWTNTSENNSETIGTTYSWNFPGAGAPAPCAAIVVLFSN